MMNTKDKWKVVEDIFMCGDDCDGCDFREFFYDTGHGDQYTCELLDGYGGKPEHCPQFENAMEALMEQEEEA